jgi:hypothetical protein
MYFRIFECGVLRKNLGNKLEEAGEKGTARSFVPIPVAARSKV